MSKPNYHHFLSVLANREPHDRPALFAPFIADSLCEQLIWRRSKQLWDTPAHYTDTMISLRERTRADVIILDARRFSPDRFPEMRAYAEEHTPEGSAFVILCNTRTIQTMAEQSPAVCAIGGYGDECSPLKKTFIRMDKTPDFAVTESAAAYFAPADAAALYDAYHDRIAIAGGLGADFCHDSEPLAIHRAVTALLNQTKNCGYLLGSGGEIPADAYLSLISLLGIYGRFR